MLRSASRGALTGAVAGLVVALGDFGASWLWLSDPLDRVELGLRLLAAEVPVGALVGALLGIWVHAFAPVTRRLAARLGRGARERTWHARLWPAPLLLLAAPALVAIAWLLFTGASASKLPLRPLLFVLAAFLLLTGAYVAIRAGRALVLAAPSMTRARAVAVVASLSLAAFVIAKVDQTVLPGLYAYLHGLLTVTSWLCVALAIGIVAVRSPRARTLDERAPAFGVASLAVLLGVLVLHLATLGTNQTVRVALLSPRAAASRSLMLALAPALSLAQSRAVAAAVAGTWRARTGPRGAIEGPTLEGAHVLLVTIDALRADHLGLYGYRTRPVSPELDRFAEEAIVFETAYAQAPHSSYSICSLMTSDYLYQRISLGLPLPTETLASVLRTVGYYTYATYIEGIFHTDGAQLEQYRAGRFGFAQATHKHIPAEAMTDEVIGEITRIVEAGEPPSFVWAHYFDVHEPYEDTSFGTTDVERYDGEIRVVDRAFARLVREVRARVTRPLVIVVTADHGEEFRDHGGVYHGSSVYQEQIRVPLLISVPGVAPRRVRTPVEIVDIAPTILGLLDIPVAPSMRGHDLRPLFASEVDRGPVFSSAGTKHMIAVWPHKLVSDLRFGTVELYALDADPHERENLADDHPELVRSLQGELHAWLGSLSGSTLDPRELALYRGRLADRDAAPALTALMLDESASSSMRSEAARLLAAIHHRDVVPGLRAALEDADPDVAAEAAISLAWLQEDPGRERLRALLEHDDADRRIRAAIGLGRLRDRTAVPVLIDALDDDEVDEQKRFEAIRLLGLLQDGRAVDALLGLLDDVRLRRRAVLALGRIGDMRAFEPLVEQLAHAQHTTVRESSARALAHLGDARAVPHLVTAALHDRLTSTSEALVRLRAIGRAVGGLDVVAGVPAEGLGQCVSQGDDHEEWSFLHRTYCETAASSVTLPLGLPRAVREARTAVVLLRMRRSDAGAAVTVRARIGERALEPAQVDGEWAEHRFTLPVSELDEHLTIEIEGGARLAIDHALVVPVP